MAGFLLQNQLEVSVFFNDIEYPLGSINLLNSLHITTTVRGSVPLLSMSINDVQHVMDKIGLQDGIPIRVVIKPNGKETRVYKFRKFSHKRVAHIRIRSLATGTPLSIGIQLLQ